MMTFDAFRHSFGPKIEANLVASMEAFPDSHEHRRLIDAIRYVLLTPGKRIRPLLCIAVENAISNWSDISLYIGATIEMIHCYSLVHDDLPAMDNDDVRRGKPSCHKAYDEATAILVGDILNTYAFEYLLKVLPSIISPEKAMAVTQKLARYCGVFGMAGGQYLDLMASADDAASLNYVQNMHRLKTGALIEACFSLVALAVSDDADIMATLTLLGQHTGLLFQIVDDILDETESLANLGKSPGKDREQNKLTYVSLLGVPQAKVEAQRAYESAMACLNRLPNATDELASIIYAIYHRIGPT